MKIMKSIIFNSDMKLLEIIRTNSEKLQNLQR